MERDEGTIVRTKQGLRTNEGDRGEGDDTEEGAGLPLDPQAEVLGRVQDVCSTAWWLWRAPGETERGRTLMRAFSHMSFLCPMQISPSQPWKKGWI